MCLKKLGFQVSTPEVSSELKVGRNNLGAQLLLKSLQQQPLLLVFFYPQLQKKFRGSHKRFWSCDQGFDTDVP